MGEHYEETVLRVQNEPDPDQREATKIAVDVSKTLMTISLAAFALIGLFARYYLSEGFSLQSPKLISLGVSAACALISMIVGFMVISAIYKAAEGNSARGTNKGFWGVEPIRGKLNGQAWLGLASIGAFVVAVTAWNDANVADAKIDMLSLQLGATSEAASATLSPPFHISGNTSHITITNDDGTSFEWNIPD